MRIRIRHLRRLGREANIQRSLDAEILLGSRRDGVRTTAEKIRCLRWGLAADRGVLLEMQILRSAYPIDDVVVDGAPSMLGSG